MTRRPRLRGGALRRRPRLAAGTYAWLTAGIVLGEVLEAPFDPVRFAYKLVLAALMTWFFVSLFARFPDPQD